MATSYLDSIGLALVWEKVKNITSGKVDKVDGKGLSSNDYTADEKAKLANIAAGAEVNVNADWNATTGDAAILNKPENASTTADGLMSSSDKTKLNGIATGAEVNQNAFSNIKVGSTTVAADEKTDTVEFVGSGITITGDATNDKVTFSASIPSAATSTPVKDGTGAVGSSAKYAREDHVHPTDTSRVATTTTINGHPLSGDVAIFNAELGNGYGSCTTAEATTAKVVAFQGYKLMHDGVVAVYFKYAVPANATMNINSTGAKPIYFKGAAIVAGKIKAGDIATFIYDEGTGRFDLLAVDRSVDAEANVVTYINDDSDGDNEIIRVIRSDNTGYNLTTPYGVSGIISSLKGVASGLCPLNSSSKIDSAYLPSYVDDVIEAYPVSGASVLSAGWLSETSGGSALTPEAGKIYVLMADSSPYSTNNQFRWGGSTYVLLNGGAGVSPITESEINQICV